MVNRRIHPEEAVIRQDEAGGEKGEILGLPVISGVKEGPPVGFSPPETPLEDEGASLGGEANGIAGGGEEIPAGLKEVDQWGMIFQIDPVLLLSPIGTPLLPEQQPEKIFKGRLFRTTVPVFIGTDGIVPGVTGRHIGSVVIAVEPEEERTSLLGRRRKRQGRGFLENFEGRPFILGGHGLQVSPLFGASGYRVSDGERSSPPRWNRIVFLKALSTAESTSDFLYSLNVRVFSL